jgi:hypothetical protein
MKRTTVLIKKLRAATGIFLLLYLLNSCTKEAFTFGEMKEFTLRSAANGATYEIKVGLPNNYNPAEKYATIYVLDGNYPDYIEFKNNINWVEDKLNKI